MIDSIIELVDDLLSRYVSDETGLDQKEEYEKMGDLDKLQLFLNTLNNMDSKDLETIKDDFESTLIGLFNYHNY